MATAPAQGPLVQAIIEALDAEIARWEARSRDDADARAVLRAFLGLREILWEFGMRPADAERPPPSGPSPESRPGRGRPGARNPARARVQRVRVQG